MNSIEYRGVTYLVINIDSNSCRHDDLLCSFHSTHRCGLKDVDCERRIFLDNTPEHRAVFVTQHLEQ